MRTDLFMATGTGGEPIMVDDYPQYFCGPVDLDGSGSRPIVSAYWRAAYEVDGREFTYAGEYNGKPCYKSGLYFLIDAVGLGYIYSNKAQPEAHLKLDGKTWDGDGWYELGAEDLPVIGDAPMDMAGGGTYTDDPAVTVTCIWPRWEKSSASDTELTGVYDEPKDGETGKMAVGLEQYLEDGKLASTYIESLHKNPYTGFHDYIGTAGRIWYDPVHTKWLRGEYGRGTWYEGVQPVTTTAVTFSPFRNNPETGAVEPDPDREPFTLYFDDYIMGAETTPGYVTEVAVWR